MNPDLPLALAIDGQTKYSSQDEKFIKVNVLKSAPCDLSAQFVKSLDDYSLSGIIDEEGTPIYRYQSITDESQFIELPYKNAVSEITIKIGAILYEKPYFVFSSSDLILLYPMSMRHVIIPDHQVDNAYAVLMKTTNHRDAMTELEDILSSKGMNQDRLFDYAAGEERDRAMVTVIRVFATGFIALISLIAAANVFNTISTNINLRRREFAMLKSVGMTAKDFNRMMNYECLLYGLKALLYGVPVSCGVTYLIYRTISSGVDSVFRLPLSAIGFSAGSVFVVIFITMKYSMHKVKRANPIDALKNENL